jgi:hypothetical protein
MRRAERSRSFVDCSVEGCKERIRRGRHMCDPHWYRVPPPLRAAIARTWSDRNLDAWRANMREARTFLANFNPAALAARITGDRP